MSLVSHAHVSGRYDAGAQRVADYASSVVGAKCSLLTMTEIYKRTDYRAVRRTLGRDWRCTRRGEYVVAVRRKDFRVSVGAGQHRRLSGAFTGRESWRDLYVYGRTVIHCETGQRIFVSVGHLASGVESGDNWRRGTSASRNVSANGGGQSTWGRWLRRAKAQKPRRALIAAMDSNLDQHRDTWRQMLTSRLGLPSVWARHQPIQGTHAGGRLIDTIHTDLKIHGAYISPAVKPAEMDHRAVVATYRIEAA